MTVFLGPKRRQRISTFLLMLMLLAVPSACGEFELVSITPTSTTLGDPDEIEEYPGENTVETVETTTTTLRPARYTVESGDSLSGISAKFGVSVDALVKANNLPNADSITVGETLVIPDPFAAVTPPWVINGIDHAGRGH